MLLSNPAAMVLAAPLPMQPPPPAPGGGGEECTGALAFACEAGNAITGAAGDVAGSAIGGVAGAGFEAITKFFTEGVGKAMGVLMSFWMKIPIPSIGDPSSAVSKLHDATLYVTASIAVLSLFLAVGKTAMAHHSASAEGAAEASKGLVRIIGASVVAVPAVVLLSQAADEYAQWLVGTAANGDVDAALTKLAGVNKDLGVGFTFVLALLSLAASLVQAFLILIRDALLILLVGALPLAAAASITGSGKQAWTKMIGWLIAFIVFKPVAAMCYATALWSVSDTSSAMNQVAGLFLIVLAVFALPALMRLIVPQVERVGSGGGIGMLAGGAAGMAGKAATGAKDATGGGGGGGSRSGGGASGGKASFKGPQGGGGGGGPSGATASPSGGAKGGGKGGGKSGATPGGSASGAKPTGGGTKGGGGAGAGLVAASTAVQAAGAAKRGTESAANGAVDGGARR